MSNLISVVIPTYNRFDYLLNAVKSVENQTYKNYEIIIINDGSDDERYYNYEFSQDIKLITLEKNSINKNNFLGPGAVRNHGINNANGKYIAFLDDDERKIRDTT